MPHVQTIQLTRPIALACVVDAAQLRTMGGGVEAEGLGDGCVAGFQPAIRGRDALATGLDDATVHNAPSDDLSEGLQRQRDELAQLLETVNGIAGGLHTLHEQMLASNRVEIAKLAVEIARKILMYKVGKGDYEIQAVVEEALKQAPARQNVVVRLNPEDLPRCQQLGQENPQSPLAELEFTADWSIGRGECLVETPKGIVKSFIEEHLERISGALQKVE